MNNETFSDGGQLLITSTMDDQSCFQLISGVLNGYPNVKNVELVDNYYKIDMSTWRHKKTIMCWIENNGQRKFLQLGYKWSITMPFSLVLTFIDVLIYLFLGFTVLLIVIIVGFFVEFTLEKSQLQNRCKQYIRHIDNILQLNEPIDNKKTSTTGSSDLTIKCPSCGASVNSDMKFCPSCGKEIPSKKFCSHCGTEVNTNMSFCPKCGTKNDN